MFQRVNTALLVMGLLVMAVLGVTVVTHDQMALAGRETSPSMMRPAAGLHVSGDFSRMTLSPDIVAMMNDSESAAALYVGGDFSHITLSPDIVAMMNDSEVVP